MKTTFPRVAAMCGLFTSTCAVLTLSSAVSAELAEMRRAFDGDITRVTIKYLAQK